MEMVVNLKNNTDTFFKYFQTQAGILKVFFNNNFINKAEFVTPSNNQNNAIDKSLIYILDDKLKQELLAKISLTGTSFQIRVWESALKIPAGKVISYQELATKIGSPKSYRAVANALGQNKIAYLIPCHRIIRKNGELGGYKWGIKTKRDILKYEKEI